MRPRGTTKTALVVLQPKQENLKELKEGQMGDVVALWI